jgi:carbamoyltransferase
MLLVADVRSEKRTDCLDQLAHKTGFDKLPVHRSVIPAVTHVDFSARVQTVDRQRNPDFYGLLRCLDELSASPVVINTSFNVRGEPIVCTPEDAYRCFMATEMDVLVLGNYLLRKEDQPAANRLRTGEHLAQFELD